ncbi:hypothetical protein PVK06_040367 [Gossypium arboreum]|uniref:Uncharacterized protein n=1 Tax=Gossypium arboreum TaxID=29729 RepID=A0ABR0N5J0_GOSAR|nr:hypothetical protein PVK06_040367 [Gossypium arboreum]
MELCLPLAALTKALSKVQKGITGHRHICVHSGSVYRATGHGGVYDFISDGIGLST